MYRDIECSSARSRARAWIRIAAFSFCLLVSVTVFSFVDSGRKDSASPKTSSLGHAKTGAREFQQININRATIIELKALPGIGESTAQRIVEYRSKNPPFRRVEELLIIRGISRSRLEQLRNRIRLD